MTGGAPTLHLVATPIGNLGDLAPRAVEVLGSVALVCCEDTRRTGRLLQHAGIRATRLAVCNEHTELSRIDDVLETLLAGDDVALVTDAGTPGISDPGERLVRATLDAGFRVSAVPGPVGRGDGARDLGAPDVALRVRGLSPASGQGAFDSSGRHRRRTADRGDLRGAAPRPAHRGTISPQRAAPTGRSRSPASSPSCTRPSRAARSARSTSASREAST